MPLCFVSKNKQKVKTMINALPNSTPINSMPSNVQQPTSPDFTNISNTPNSLPPKKKKLSIKKSGQYFLTKKICKK